MRETVRRLDGILCDLAEIANPGARGFVVLDDDDLPMKVFVVRHDSGVRGYVNRCPHNRIPLDFKPDDFLNLGKTHIQCATHGALFLMGDGLCVEGPCRGKRLDAFPVTVLNGRIQCGDPRQTRVGQGDRHSPLDPPGKGTKTLNRSREK